MRKFVVSILLLTVSLPVFAGQYGIQVGAFQEFERAEATQSALEDAGFNTYFSEIDGFKRVRVGPFTSKEKAEAEAKALWPFLVARFGPNEFERPWVVEEDREIENAPISPVDGPAHIFADKPSEDLRISSNLIEYAKTFFGVPYRWGGTTSEGFDCSGFVQYIFARANYQIPRQAKNQFKVGETPSDDELTPGDLVFFSTYTRGASHVGIYIGNGEFIQASSGEGSVCITPLSKRYYSNRYLGARRILSLDREVVKQMTALVNN